MKTESQALHVKKSSLSPLMPFPFILSPFISRVKSILSPLVFLLIFQFPTILLAETEPNESCATANLLLDTATSTDSGYLNGTVDNNSDDDYFKIILTQRAELRLDKHDRNNKKTRAKVLEGDCSTSLGSTNSKDRTNWKFLLDAGTYYIHFYRSNADNAQYKIKAKMNRVADFVVSKSVDNATPSAGDTITYTISTTNNGPSNSKVHVTDALPTGLTFVSENQSECSQSGNGLDCKKWLNSGSTFEVDLEASVNGAASGLITNTVNVEKDTTNSYGDKTFESDLTNNSASANITVAAIDEITSFTAPSEVTEGETITVTVSYNASEAREIVTGFQQNHSPWNGWGWTTVTVSAGVGTVNIPIDIPTGQPLGNGYQIPIVLEPVGGNWSTRLDVKAKNPVNLIANQPPTANSQSITVDENSTNNAITLTGDDPDGDNSALSYTVVTPPSHGTLSGTAPNLTYTPTAGYHGADNFTFKVNDGVDDSSAATVSITVAEPLTIVENADDICYNDIESSGIMCMDMGICSGGIGCKNSIPLENIGDGVLSDISVLYDESGGMGGTYGSNNCGVDPAGTCQTTSGIDMGPIGIMGQVTEYNLTNPMPIGDNTQSVWASEFMSGQCFGQENIYATYIKDGVLHRGQVRSCNAPPPPPDESVPNDDSNATEASCGTFADMFQTHGTCSGNSGGTINFNNAGSLLDGSTNIILGNNDNSLNTCQVTTPSWVSNQYETCGDQGDCVETGVNGGTLSINYNNPPATATVTANPSSSTDDLTLSANSTLSGYEYDDITTSWHTNIHTIFDITNQLKINTLKMTNNNIFDFQSSSQYSLEIGTLGIVNNGTNNTITTDDNAKNIKINNFTLKSGTTLSLKAAQTLKMDTLSVGYGSDIYLKAQYININNFTLDSAGNGDNNVTIVADYIDIGDFNINNHSDGATITIRPFTPGKRVLFRANTIEEGSNSTFIFYSGNYYVNASINLPGTSDVSAIRAYDSNQLINMFINDDLNPGNNPGINSDGNNGNYGTNPAANFMIFINGDLNTGGGGTTFNATIYTEGDVTIGNPTYIKGAVNANNSIDVGQGQFTYDQNITDGGWGECNNPYCSSHNLTEGFHVIDPDGGDNNNSFEIFCHKDTNDIWHDLIALPIKNSSNNFLFDSNTTTSNYYDTTANPRTDFNAIEINGEHITYNGTKPTIPVVTTRSDEPWQITTDGHTYNVLGSKFSNINLIGTPFKIDWDSSGPLEGCNESLLRKALGQAVKYNTINTDNGTDNDGKSRCKITTMNLTLLDDYQYLTYNSNEVLQHSCKEMASYVPNNILSDSSIAGHFNILTSEPSYPIGVIPTTNGSRDNATDIGDTNHRPLTVYCKYQTDLGYVWTFLTALDGKVTQSKNDLVNHHDTCSQLGLYFYVPNNKDTFNRVRKYLKSSKNGNNGWENYTGTINEKIQAFHPGNQYYLTAFRDTIIWPYGPLGVYFPLNGNHKADGTSADWGNGANSPKGYMSGSPLHNIKSMANYDDSLGKKGWVSILGSQDLNKTDDWWIADIGAGEEIGNSSPGYSPHGTHPIQSSGYVYYEPNGNYTANAWLNFIYDSEGWIYHADDWNDNYPYYDYMCMSETNYDATSRYTLVPGFFNAIERETRPGNTGLNFSDENITTKIVNKPIKLDVILYKLNPITLSYDKTQLETDQNKSVGVFISSVEEPNPPVPIKFLGTYQDFSGNNGRIQILPDFNLTSANKRAVVQFYYCNAADTNWTTCWNYNGPRDSPTISSLGGGDHSDSVDDFAVRPDKFEISLPTSPIHAGNDFNITFLAKDGNDNNTTDYNEIVGNSFTVDVNETKSGCLTGIFIPNIKTGWSFADGNHTIESNYSEVGKVNIKIHEINGSEFASIDANDTNDSARLITPEDINVTFIPHHFDINATLHNIKDNNFTYLSQDLNMSALLDINVTAKNKQNRTTTNYNSNCYAQKTDYNISYNDINISPNVNNLNKLMYFETNTSKEGNASINSDINLSDMNESIFGTDHNGTASIHIKINFDRNETKVVNPFKLNIRDINVTDKNGTFGTKNLDKNATFYYGRVHAPDYRFAGSNGNATIYYEVYSDQNKSKRESFGVDGNESVDSINWYVNIFHTDNSSGDYNESAPIPKDGTVPTIIDYKTLELSHPAPHKDKITLTPSSWLVYDLFNSNATTTDFLVEFYNPGGEWAGKGGGGHAVDTNISVKQNRRLDW